MNHSESFYIWKNQKKGSRIILEWNVSILSNRFWSVFLHARLLVDNFYTNTACIIEIVPRRIFIINDTYWYEWAWIKSHFDLITFEFDFPRRIRRFPIRSDTVLSQNFWPKVTLKFFKYSLNQRKCNQFWFYSKKIPTSVLIQNHSTYEIIDVGDNWKLLITFFDILVTNIHHQCSDPKHKRCHLHRNSVINIYISSPTLRHQKHDVINIIVTKNSERIACSVDKTVPMKPDGFCFVLSDVSNWILGWIISLIWFPYACVSHLESKSSHL